MKKDDKKGRNRTDAIAENDLKIGKILVFRRDVLPFTSLLGRRGKIYATHRRFSHQSTAPDGGGVGSGV